MSGVGVVSFVGIGIDVCVQVGGNQITVGVVVDVAIIGVELDGTSIISSIEEQAENIAITGNERNTSREIENNFLNSISLSLLWKIMGGIKKRVRRLDDYCKIGV